MRQTVEHNELSAESFESQQNLPRMGAESFPYDLVAQRAYELWEEGGRIDGQALGDWLRAEAEIRKSLDKSPNDEGIDAGNHQGWVTAEAGSGV
jgi:Protein of unknown function (DUF2934)